jgi:hypothetical protein
MVNSLIKSDAIEFAEAFVPHPLRAHKAQDYQAAYEEGAKQVLRYLQQFAGRVNGMIPPIKSTGFQDGQVDGILWTVEHVSTLFGIE